MNVTHFPPRAACVCGCVSTAVPMSVSMCVWRETETNNLPSFRNTLMCSCCLLFVLKARWMTNPGWKHSHVGVWVHEPSLRGQYESPGLPPWCILLARCLRNMATEVGLELCFNSAAQFPGHISGSEPMGSRRYQVQCLHILQNGGLFSAANLLFSNHSFWTWGPVQKFPEHNGFFPHFSWDQSLLLSYLLRFSWFE